MSNRVDRGPVLAEPPDGPVHPRLAGDAALAVALREDSRERVRRVGALPTVESRGLGHGRPNDLHKGLSILNLR